MNNPQNRPTPNPSHPSRPLENDGNVNTKIQTDVPTPASFKEGYLHGRTSERSLENQRQEVRDENTSTRAVLLGIALTSLAGLVLGSLFFLNQKQEAPTPVLVPSPTATQQPETETTIIERTTENTEELAPIDQQSPATFPQSQPDIRVTIPSAGQQRTSAGQDTTVPTAPALRQNQTLPTNPNTTQRNPTRQVQPAPSQNSTGNSTSTRTQPNTTNPTLPTQIQNQGSTGTSTRTQPNTNDSTLPTQIQNQGSTGTSTRTQPNSNDSTLPNQSQNQPSTDSSTTTQPNTTNQESLDQTQNQPSIDGSTTTQPNTTNQDATNQGSLDQTQNQTQPANSNSNQ